MLEIIANHHEQRSSLKLFLHPLRAAQTFEATYVMFRVFHFSVHVYVLMFTLLLKKDFCYGTINLGGRGLEICHVFVDSILFKQYIHCSFLPMEGWRGHKIVYFSGWKGLWGNKIVQFCR